MGLRALVSVMAVVMVAGGSALAAKSTAKAPAKNAVAATAAPANATPAAAASTTTAPKRSLREMVEGRLRVGFGMSLNSSLVGASLNQGKTTVASVELPSGNTAALELKWVQSLYQGPKSTKFNWYSGLTFERERSIGTINVKILNGPNAGSTLTLLEQAQKPTYQTNLVSAGIEWTPNQYVYVPLGLNLPILTRASVGDGSFSLDPKIGFQAGIGARPTKNVEVELLYRRLTYGISLTNAELKAFDRAITGTADASGANFAARYIF